LRKVALFLLLPMALLLLVGQWIVRSHFFSDNMRLILETEAETWMGRKMRIGKIDLRFFPPAVVLHDIAQDDSRPHSDFRAASVTIHWNLRSLFSGEALLSRIIVDAPVLSLTPQGLREKPFLRDPTRKARVAVGKMTMTGGAIAYRQDDTDPAAGLPKSVESFSLWKLGVTVSPDAEMRRFAVALVGEAGEIVIAGHRRPIDHLVVSATFAEGEIHLENVRVASGRATASASGAIVAGKPFDLQMTATVPLSEMPAWRRHVWSGTLAGSGRLTGRPPALQFVGSVAADAVRLDQQEIGAVRAHLKYRDRKWAATALSGTVLAGTIDGTAEADPSTYRVDLKYRKVAPKQALFLLHPDLAKKIAEKIDLIGVTVDGDLVLSGAPKAMTASGEMVARRSPNKGRLTLSHPLAQVIGLVQEARTRWTWSGNRLTLTDGEADVSGSRATFSALWDGGWSMQIAAEQAAVAPLAAIWKVPATGQMRIAGALTANRHFSGILSFADGWALQDRPLGAATAHFVYADRRLTIGDGTLRDRPTATDIPPSTGGPPHWRFTGTLDFSRPNIPRFDVRADLFAADPWTVLSFFKVSIPLETRATGVLLATGTPSAFSVSGPLRMDRGGKLYGESFDRGRLDLTVTEKKVLLGQVVLERRVAGVATPTRLRGQGEIGYDGRYRFSAKTDRLRQSDRLRARLPALSGEMQVTAKGEGTFHAPQLQIDVLAKSLVYDKTAIGDATATLRLADKTLRIDGRIAKRQTTFHGQIDLANRQPFSFSSRFVGLRLDPFVKARLPAGLSDLQMTTTGQIEVDGYVAEPERINLTATLTDFFGRLNDYPFRNDGPIEIHAGAGVYTVDRARLVGDNTALVVYGTLVPLKFWNLFINGEADLNLLTGLTPQIRSGRGVARLDLRISEAWKSPKIQGEVSLTQGIVRTTRFPSIYVAALSAVFNERILVLERLEGRLGGGPFRIEGQVELAGFRPRRFATEIDLQHVEVPLLSDLSATFDGTLHFDGDTAAQRLTGDVAVSNTLFTRRIDLKTFLLEIGKPKAKRAASPFDAVALNLLVRGKENLWVQNNLARLPLEVDLSIRGTMGDPLPLGRVEIPSGHLYFQNNDFQIVAGQVEFLNMEKIDPTFDIRANTRVRHRGVTDSISIDPAQERETDNDYLVDLSLFGTLSQFTVNLTSTPPLPEKDLQALLSGEATALIVSEFLETPIRKITGIDRVRVVPDPTKASAATRIVAEKRLLNDRLSVHYSTTLDVSEEPSIRILYELSPRLLLVGEQDERGRKGGDLRFQFHLR